MSKGDSAIEGAHTSLYCATSPKAPERGAGRYYIGPKGKLQPKYDWLEDKEGNAELWRHSEAAVEKF